MSTTHPAVVTASVRGPLQVIQVPTIAPSAGEVLVRVEWTASTPLDLHQNDGGLLVQHPQVLGGNIAGTVVELGADVKRLRVGDKVGFVLLFVFEFAIYLYILDMFLTRSSFRSSDSRGESRKKKHTRH